jgi:DNA-3-methyladenine glycosylase II
MEIRKSKVKKEYHMPQETLAFTELVQQALTHLSAVDPGMQAIIAEVGPCTLQPEPDVFDALVNSIISQQISIKAAAAIMGRVYAALPDGKVVPEAILALEPARLRELGLSNSKVRYVHNLAEHVVSGQLQLKHLGEYDDEEVIRQLTAVKGIGRWTAEMCLIFTLCRPDVWPVDDLGLVEGLRIACKLETRPTKKEAMALGEAWRPYRTFVCWYLWRWRRL